MGVEDPRLTDVVLDTLNEWNRDHVQCVEPRHGRMRAVRGPGSSQACWRCPRCADRALVTREQLTEAVTSAVTRGLRAAEPVWIPEEMKGAVGDGTVRVPRRFGTARFTVWLSNAELSAMLCGSLGGAALFLLMPTVGLLAMLGIPLVAAVIARVASPAHPVLREREFPAGDLQQGDWVRLGMHGHPAGLATRVVAATTCSTAAAHPGTRVRLLNQSTVDCRTTDHWIVLDLGRTC